MLGTLSGFSGVNRSSSPIVAANRIAMSSKLDSNQTLLEGMANVGFSAPNPAADRKRQLLEQVEAR